MKSGRRLLITGICESTLYRRGNRIRAMAAVRSTLGVSLAEAADIIRSAELLDIERWPFYFVCELGKELRQLGADLIDPDTGAAVVFRNTTGVIVVP